MGARINVGRTLAQLGRLEEAEAAYYQALEYFPKPKKGLFSTLKQFFIDFFPLILRMFCFNLFIYVICLSFVIV